MIKWFLNRGFPVLLCGLSVSVYALPPTAPALLVEREGLQIKIAWDDLPTAEGYRLYFAPYGSLAESQNIDLGKQSEASAALPNGSSYSLWITAYNASGESRYSNIEHVLIDNKVVAFLPENTRTGTQLQAGLQEAFADFPQLRLETVWVDVNDSKKLTDLFFGTETVPGYADDPNVVAVVTATTGQTLALTKYELENPPVVISCTGTSTQLVNIDNVVVLAPDNLQQGKLVFNTVNAYAESNQQQVGYAILLDTRTSSAAYAFDAYDYVLLHDIDDSIRLQENGGLNAENQPIVHAQLMGAFSYDSSVADSIDTALAGLDALQAPVVFHVGMAANLQTVMNKRPNMTWVGADSFYTHEDFQGKNAAVISMSGELKDYGYDAGGFLKEVVNALSADLIHRQGILSTIRDLSVIHQGRTGAKGYYVEVPGSFDLMIPTADGWQKLLNSKD
ncbi:hypothetical protein [Thioflexithrix psekupsensis]|uniref:Fibronectin type-III domain-containing protein n=1 Tax=Thioflexithrix psekupsensis TaxID=1570016 RepID=A0A251XBF9_9GAMM|nr:hypothetical protein [Thioflexithrix psekupsensis]OUD15633.1 hypothetical protein TPSD3_03690 [Thioflexithrix psekupsensis]